MSNKSGIEMIEEIIDKVNTLDRRFTIVEQMMKQLLNVSNQKNTKVSINPVTKEKPKHTIRVMGKIKNEKQQTVIGVNVKVYDKDDNIVKETKTNKAGEWMCFLPPGKYIAECKLNNIINSNVQFNISPNDKLVRVAQPK